MDYQISEEHQGKIVHLNGQFTFNDNPKFKQIINLAENASGKSLQLELSGMTFIDSAGLGMLLLLRDVCQKQEVKVRLSGAQGQVARIFEISKFDQMFSLS